MHIASAGSTVSKGPAGATGDTCLQGEIGITGAVGAAAPKGDVELQSVREKEGALIDKRGQFPTRTYFDAARSLGTTNESWVIAPD